jgi:hypothetical protein
MSNDDNFAHTRSHLDAKIATELARASAWAAILLNGGGAAVVLAFGPPMAFAASYALAGFAIGAFAGAMMLFSLFQWIERWNIYWGDMALGIGQPETNAARLRAEKMGPWVTVFFVVAMLCFLVAGGALVTGMLSLAGPAT